MACSLASGSLKTLGIFAIIILRIHTANFTKILRKKELTQLCPDERSLCHEKAAIGDCFGGSLKASVLMNKCKCSCEAVHHRRIQNCCQTVGSQDMKFCLPLCGYNTTVRELSQGLGIKCVSQLNIWTYCAADTNDNTPCCLSRGVTHECLSFCKGDVPTCDIPTILSYQTCLLQLDSILKCQAEGLNRDPNYDPNWKASCDWDGELPIVKQIRTNLENLFRPLPGLEPGRR